ncbi:ATP-binding protein [Conexibacter woesei]|uniref:Putative anti-sigma regulatory factor, serine/threonine protein kinase n=1 Tax=Conexibacter woesei (strain DSM 14684 / CCUG 47730 / CIP 108061 / JCM 11494 / NBRC 100937 / ID131577) TaxID=469383 RepID=D3EZ88_CONWI|nr:ATP-binding protein [Conexibacter woesei]ADB51853.1 putative anti-sigma regulatory factor, serine/threonine protein kinase [Conexibacter woesei DSM 14684]
MNADARISPRRSHHRRHQPAGEAERTDGSDGALPGGLALTLPATSEAPTLARRAAGHSLAHWTQDRRDAALLVISELVTNAVRHGSADRSDQVTLRVRRRGLTTRIEVTDARSRDGTLELDGDEPLDGADRRSGWGLPIVAELSDRWGVERGPGRTCVWCEIDV